MAAETRGPVAAAEPELDLGAVRSRFSSLKPALAFLDAPAGTQVPDEVVEAMRRYLLEDNANVDGAFPRSLRSTELVSRAREAGARFFNCSAPEIGFGANMTSLNFQLSRTAARNLHPGDEIIVTRLDHDANIAPWLELAHDRGFVVHLADIHDDTRLDVAALERLLNRRTRIVAFPWASNAVGTITDVKRVVELAHSVDAIAWVDAVHYAPHGPMDVRALGADVVLCSPYKFFGPHLGMFYGRHDLLESWLPYRVRPASPEPVAHRFETGTLAHENLAGFVAAVEYVHSLGWEAIRTQERRLGARFLAGLPSGYRLHGLSTMEGRVPTFAVTLAAVEPDVVAEQLARRGIAAWSGNYYALEIMNRLGLPQGAVRIGFVHYNSELEVDRVLEALGEIAAGAS